MQASEEWVGTVKYRVVGHVTISVSVLVEAKSEKKAKTSALQMPMQTFCYECANGQDDEWSTSGELDGEVTVTAVEEA